MTTTSSPDAAACHVCGAPGLVLIPAYRALSRTTSDCKVWPAGGQMGVCSRCGCAQAVLDAAWNKDAGAIYGDYQIYHQSAGAEQSVFDSVSGQPLTRSAFLVQRLKEKSLLPVTGRMMDFGCGIGNLLRSFGAIFPDWTLAGLELSDAQRQKVESIPKVERLFTPPLNDVPGEFDLITMVHSLEHIPSPLACLGEIRAKLKPGGLLLVDVPDCAANPFMFLVADHSSHFCLPVLQRLVLNAGFEIVVATNQWIAKELTVVARKAKGPASPSWSAEGAMDAAALNGSIAWLERLSREARTLSARKPFGIFGTSIAATFLFGELGHAVEFFVDEDPGRQGQVFNGRPIYAPRQVPAGGNVFIGLAPVAAARVMERMRSLRLNAHFFAPPDLNYGTK